MRRSHSFTAPLVGPPTPQRKFAKLTNYVIGQATKRSFSSPPTMTVAARETRKRHSRPASSGRKFIPVNGALTLFSPVSFIQSSADTKKQWKRVVRLLNLLQTVTLDITSSATTWLTSTAWQRLKTCFGKPPSEKWRLLSCRT